MLKLVTNVLIYGTYLIVVGFLAFALWQALFSSHDAVESQSKEHASQSGEQHAGKSLTGSGVAPSPHNPTEQAIADYTWWLAIFTSLLVLATVALFVSGERNVEVARESAKAAKTSANIAERALIAGQRAFISASFTQSPVVNADNGNVVSWIFKTIWSNAGNTPTREMRNHINIRIFDGPIPDDWDYPDQWSANVPENQRGSIPLGIAPKAKISGQAVSMSLADLEAIIRGPKQALWWGWAEYKDVFPNTPLHVARFAVRIAAGGVAGNPQRVSFDYPYVAKYNCSDEECDRQGYPAGWSPRECPLSRRNSHATTTRCFGATRSPEINLRCHGGVGGPVS